MLKIFLNFNKPKGKNTMSKIEKLFIEADLASSKFERIYLCGNTLYQEIFNNRIKNSDYNRLLMQESMCLELKNKPF